MVCMSFKSTYYIIVLKGELDINYWTSKNGQLTGNSIRFKTYYMVAYSITQLIGITNHLNQDTEKVNAY